ncbi:MAG TPA: ethanolamine permease, partial [Vicinamibacteria bacterium]|nr:ethanolamine permease [Vicinamibacteria bacterium]
WFYLGIEGIANVAEEAEDPQRSLPRGFGWSMATLVVLALLTFTAAVGVAGWRAVVFPPGSDTPSDSPLPLALRLVVGEGHPMYQLLVTVGLFGLVASFHGLLLAAGRATFELGRAGYLPGALGRVLAARGTPATALAVNMVAGLVALATGRTAEIIVIAVFGALTMYAVSMAAFFALRTRARHAARPFRAPAGPLTAGLALVLSAGALVALAYHNPRLFLVFALVMALGAAFSALAARRSPGPAAEAALP